MEDGLIKVISPIDDTPAAKAGIKPGDFIAAIDGASIQGLASTMRSTRCAGRQARKITLTILRAGEKKPFDVTLARAVVRVDSATWRREGDIGYIRLPGFNEQTASGLEKACANSRSRSARASRAMSSTCATIRAACSIRRSRCRTISSPAARSSPRAAVIPKTRSAMTPRPATSPTASRVVVLINGGTASASEIVAGALQDHKRATVVGMTSFGKGSVQTIIPLGEGGGALRLTTARYYTPSGHSIQAQGIIPDIAVAQGDEDQMSQDRASERSRSARPSGRRARHQEAGRRRHPARPGKKYDDFQLSYALDLLHGKMTVAAAKSGQAD